MKNRTERRRRSEEQSGVKNRTERRRSEEPNREEEE